MEDSKLGVDEKLAWEIADQIEAEFISEDEILTVEDIRDKVEELLVEYERFDVSRNYIIYRNKQEELRKPGWRLVHCVKCEI